eukprot:TRINITY_DN2926_c0_g1_i1.p1 TRINITY_DN2926_c0_g1~~TRINITY_DN2926_c0_g1_i1.p1  ORF type:complete len:436 (-),score=93.38 TRINITY_DN2926_c0_g1_i1:59-1366(-)
MRFLLSVAVLSLAVIGALADRGDHNNGGGDDHKGGGDDHKGGGDDHGNSCDSAGYCGQGIFANWNLGLEESHNTQRSDAILEVLKRTPQVDAICLTELWGGASRYRQYLQHLSGKYPYWLSTVPVDYLTQDDDMPLTYLPPCSHGLDVNAFGFCAYGCGGGVACQLGCVRQQYTSENIEGNCWGCLIEQAILVQGGQKSVHDIANVCNSSTTQPWNWTFGNLLLSKYPIKTVAVGTYGVNPLIPTGYLLGTVPALGGLLLGCTHLTSINDNSTATVNYYETLKYLRTVSSLRTTYPDQILMGDYNHGPDIAAHNVHAVGLPGYIAMTSNGYSCPYVSLDGECTVCPEENVANSNHSRVEDHLYVSTSGSGLLDFSKFIAQRAFSQDVSIVNSTDGVVGSPSCIQSKLSDHYGEYLSIFGNPINSFDRSVNTCYDP